MLECRPLCQRQAHGRCTLHGLQQLMAFLECYLLLSSLTRLMALHWPLRLFSSSGHWWAGSKQAFTSTLPLNCQGLQGLLVQMSICEVAELRHLPILAFSVGKCKGGQLTTAAHEDPACLKECHASADASVKSMPKQNHVEVFEVL